jgi:uncharacterized lipoprotein
METVNQSLIGILVSLVLGGCVASQPTTGATADQTDQTAARLLIPVEGPLWDGVDLFADAPRFTDPDGATT